MKRNRRPLLIVIAADIALTVFWLTFAFYFAFEGLLFPTFCSAFCAGKFYLNLKTDLRKLAEAKDFEVRIARLGDRMRETVAIVTAETAAKGEANANA